MPLPPGWPCKGPLLDLGKIFFLFFDLRPCFRYFFLAVDVASRILPAFNTTTGMPYGSINLRHGVSKDETPITW